MDKGLGDMTLDTPIGKVEIIPSGDTVIVRTFYHERKEEADKTTVIKETRKVVQAAHTKLAGKTKDIENGGFEGDWHRTRRVDLLMDGGG